MKTSFVDEEEEEVSKSKKFSELNNCSRSGGEGREGGKTLKITISLARACSNPQRYIIGSTIATKTGFLWSTNKYSQIPRHNAFNTLTSKYCISVI